MKNNQRKQVYKLFAGFLVFIYLGNLYPSLLFSVIPLSIVFTIYFYLMDIMGRHPELILVKPNIQFLSVLSLLLNIFLNQSISTYENPLNLYLIQ